MTWLSIPCAHCAITFSTLVSFTGTNGLYPGAAPASGLVQCSDGNFYGTTTFGGTYKNGTVFRLAPGGAFTSLFSFNGTNGAHPYGTLIQGADGSLDGTTSAGGTSNGGTIFQITTQGAFNSLFSFSAANMPSSGSSPGAALVQSRDGSFFGTAEQGGAYTNTIPFAGGNGYGTVFQLTTNGMLNVPVFFNNTNGAHPSSGLLLGSDGNYYGTTTWGGTGIGPAWPGYGTVFKMAPDGTFTNIYSFSGSNDGGFIYAGLVQGGDGNLYGAAFNGGPLGFGTLFKVSTSGTFTNLHTFNDFDGDSPYAAMIQASDGNFYGTTYGYFAQLSIGTIFQLAPNGVFTNLYSFPLSGINGDHPTGVLVQGADGNLYGTTSAGGANGYGTIFRLSVPMPPVIESGTITNGTIRFTWSAVVGQTYQVQFKSDLTLPTWGLLGNSFTATNGVVTTTDSVATDSQRVYRVALLP